jgi:predicted GIY-YIG superfamily endonuclease
VTTGSTSFCLLRRDVEHLVYRCWDADGALLYIGCTNSLSQRKCHHRKRMPWWAQVTAITAERHPNRDTGLAAERAAIRAENPIHNVERYAR